MVVKLYSLLETPIRDLCVMTIFLMAMLAIVFIYSDVSEESRTLKPASENVSSSFSPSNYISSLKGGEHKARRLPQAIIIGSRKSGTRALLKFLEVNPAIKAAHSEVHFFDKPQNYKLGLDWYRSQMPESSSHEVTIEKSPAYFVTRGVPQKVKAMNSSIKLILIFRDPVIRLISDFSQIVANRIESLADENDASGDYNALDANDQVDTTRSNGPNNVSESIWDEAETDFVDYVSRLDGGIDEQRRAVKIGMYSNYLESWKALFPMNQFHFVNGETLISDPYEVVHKLELFLGLTPVVKPGDFVFNKRKGFFCLASNDSTAHVDSKSSQEAGGGYHNAGNSVNHTKPAMSYCLNRSKGRRHVKVKKELLDELRKFYAPYNEYLYSLVGQNFNWSAIKA